MISIGIIENNNVLRQNLVQFFNRQQGMSCTHEAAHTTDFFQKTTCDTRLHVVLHEFDSRSMTAAKDISFLKKTYPKTEVIILSKNDDSDSVMKAFYAGATGYLSKATSFVKIKEAIVDTCEGKSAISPTVARRLVEHFSPKKSTAELTPKESQLVQCLTDGLSYKLAADQLSVSVNTVLFHIRNLYKKLGVNSKSEVVAMRLRGECRFTIWRFTIYDWGRRSFYRRDAAFFMKNGYVCLAIHLNFTWNNMDTKSTRQAFCQDKALHFTHF